MDSTIVIGQRHPRDGLQGYSGCFILSSDRSSRVRLLDEIMQRSGFYGFESNPLFP